MQAYKSSTDGARKDRYRGWWKNTGLSRNGSDSKFRLIQWILYTPMIKIVGNGIFQVPRLRKRLDKTRRTLATFSNCICMSELWSPHSKSFLRCWRTKNQFELSSHLNLYVCKIIASICFFALQHFASTMPFFKFVIRLGYKLSGEQLITGNLGTTTKTVLQIVRSFTFLKFK